MVKRVTKRTTSPSEAKTPPLRRKRAKISSTPMSTLMKARDRGCATSQKIFETRNMAVCSSAQLAKIRQLVLKIHRSSIGPVGCDGCCKGELQSRCLLKS